MNILKKQAGITLIALAISIIVLLILAGISVIIADNLIIDRAVTAHAKTVEEMLKERVEMTIIDVKSSYLMEKNNLNIITEEDYYNAKMKEYLENSDGISSAVISDSSTSGTDIELLYKNKSYLFKVSPSGNVTLGNSIKSNIKIGDYVEYPITYTDIYSGEQYTSTNGWRVIDNGIMEGTSGYIKLISTGIPLWWDYKCNEYAETESLSRNEVAIKYLLETFEEVDLINRSGTSYKGNIFNDGDLAYKVSTITFEDMNLAYNKLYGTNVDLRSMNTFEDSKKLFNLTSETSYFYYWIANAKPNTDDIYYISDEEGIESESSFRIGIRPVIYLKNGLDGTFENGVWKFTD